MDKVDTIIFKTLCVIVSCLMFGMMALVSAQVFFRYVLDKALTWSDELGRFMFIWMSFLGACAAYYKGSHVALDLFVRLAKGTSKKILTIVIDLFTLVFSVALTISGSNMVQVGLLQRSPSLSIQMNFVFMVLPASGVILSYFCLRKIYKQILSPKGDI